jgi:hypothetical protein
MCDYSLAHFPNRLAVEGEQLQVYRFSSGSLGLIAQRPNFNEMLCPTAVCVPPGARLLLNDIPDSLQQSLGVAEVEEVSFVEQSAREFSYRDAVRFANGREVLLQHLRCGQRVHVLSLSSTSEQQEDRHSEQEREVFVP